MADTNRATRANLVPVLSTRVFLTGVVIAAVALLAQTSGVGAIVATSTERALDSVPVVLGIEREARIHLRAAIPVDELPVLAADWAVRVEGFQHTYAAAHRPLTVGAAVPPGSDLGFAVEQHKLGVRSWVQLRLSRMVQLASGMTNELRVSMEQNAEDLKMVQATIDQAGVRVSQVDVRGPAAIVDRLHQHPLVASVTARAR